jgi:hypothetical protein
MVIIVKILILLVLINGPLIRLLETVIVVAVVTNDGGSDWFVLMVNT